jgi:hypothetical protein
MERVTSGNISSKIEGGGGGEGGGGEEEKTYFQEVL